MKTKKFLLAALTMMCAMTMTTMFTACGSDDDDNNNGSSADDKKASKVEMIMEMPLTEDMLKYCDIVVTYSDGTDTKTETVTTLDYSKTLTSKLPATFTFGRTVKMKSDVDPSTMGKFAYKKGLITGAVFYNAAGKKLSALSLDGAVGSGSGDGASMAERINEGKQDFSYTYAFDADGNKLQ